MLRPNVLTSVADALGKTPALYAGDFSIESADWQSKGSILTLTYRHSERYRFVATIGDDVGSEEFKIGYKVSPGILNDSERGSVEALELLLNEITAWVKRIKQDLEFLPLYRLIEQQQAQIDAVLEKLSDAPDEQFTVLEIEDLRSKLEQLRHLFEESIERSNTTQAETKAKLAALNAEIELLRTTLVSQSKRNWWSSFKAKTAKWSRDPDNAQLLKSGAEVVKALLLPAEPSK